MSWEKAKLKKVAPAIPSRVRFAPDDKVWILTLDQIESQTGRIINKQIAAAEKAGTSTNNFDEGNVLYSKLRPYLNKVVCPQEKGIATTELVPLRPNPKFIERSYLTYYLRSPSFLNFATLSVAGVKMPRLIMDTFWEHEIPLPPPKEQRRIVEILDQADELRQKRAEADQLATRILPALFIKMFGDPATNPHNFNECEIKKIAEVKGGKRLPKGSDYSPLPTPFRYIRGTDIEPNKILKNQLLYLYPETQKKISRYTVDVGDVVITIAGKIGAAAYIDESLSGANLTENAAKLVAINENDFNPIYLSVFLNLPYAQSQILTLQGKVTIGKLALFRIETLKVLLPPFDLQQKFAEEVTKLEQMQIQQEIVKKTLDKLWNVLLHRAFSGELTAQWREAHMKELLEEMETMRRELDLPNSTTARLF